jgi:two-component system NtrC family response regulator
MIEQVGSDAGPEDPARDFALVVGIEHYAHVPALPGAVADARRFHTWLCDDAGGGVARERARLLVSAPGSMAPGQAQLDAALGELVATARTQGGGRRLYFYFSGHAAVCGSSGEDIGLVLASWSRSAARLALSARAYRSALAATGAFEELVVVLDCCRILAERVVGLPPVLALPPRSPGVATREFVVFATEPWRSAFDPRPEPRWHGVLTRQLIAILQRSAAGIAASDLQHAIASELASTGHQAHILHSLRDTSAFGGRGAPVTASPDSDRGPAVRAPASERPHPPGPVPLLATPAARNDYSDAARELSVAETCGPLGPPPHHSRLFVFVRRRDRATGPRDLPSEPIAILDATGRALTAIGRDTARSDDQLGYVALSARVAPGTYRIRGHSRRELAITIPPHRAAQVFIADSGAGVDAVRLDELRLALVPIDQPFDPASPTAQAMESLIAALRSPDRSFPLDARAVLPDAVDQDLCFGIAAAHQLWRSGDQTAFEQVVHRLAQLVRSPDIAIPDVAILDQLRRTPQLAGPPALDTPPVLRASLVLAMTRPEFAALEIAPDSASAHAAATGLHDSIWCTWRARAWDERWIEPTVASLGSQSAGSDAGSIARSLALPIRTVRRAIRSLEAKLPPRGSAAMPNDALQIPGYTIDGMLGRGDRGTVWKAIRTLDDRVVALKVLPLRGGRAQRERIERELDAVRRLDHPGIVSYDHRGALPGDTGLWLDMELCRGSALDLVSASGAALALDQAGPLVWQALDALEYLHNRGIVHRNLKPSNLLVRANGSVAIGDVGLVNPAPRTGEPDRSDAVGTVRFTPHEQLVGHDHAQLRSDVWSIAATLYFLLTLDAPRDEYAGQSELEAALNNPVVPIAERWPGAAKLGEDLARWFDRALASDVWLRPKDCAELRAGLAAALGLPAALTESSGSLDSGARLRDDAPRPGRPDRIDRGSLRSGAEPVRPRKLRSHDTWQTEQQEDSAIVHVDLDQEIAHVRIVSGKPSHPVHVLSAIGTSIGRLGGDCHIGIDDRRMSRRHARIERSASGWQLQDLGARNRGFIDGRGYGAGERVPLGDGAVLRFGDTLMVFRAQPPINDGRSDWSVFPGVSRVAVAVRRRIDALATGDGHVLIVGETGAGKERVAQAIGAQRAPQPFVTVNSAELSSELGRSELFGHVRGAFTNATTSKPGLVDVVGDGVLFLDEIGELSLDVQAELLRFLEDGTYRPLGATELRHSSARVVAATHVDLEQAAQTGRFRRDLLARLRASNAPLVLPALRDRREDIPGWTELFFRERDRDVGPNPWTVGALECLLLYPWPDNLRHLRGVVGEAASNALAFPCGTEDLPAALRSHRGMLRTADPGAPSSDRAAARFALQASEPTQSEIELALREAQGNMRMAAQRLGVDRRKLYRLCKQFGIAHDQYRLEIPQDD